MRQLKKLPRNKCWLVGYSKAEADAMEIAREFNKEWETNLRIGLHDCRDYTNSKNLFQTLCCLSPFMERTIC